MLFETSVVPAPVFGLRRDMNRLFDDVLTRTMPSNAWSPAVDVREDQQEITMDVELPGVKPDDVEMTCDNGLLTIRGQKSAERKEGDESEYHLIERSYGSFSRSFRLPKGVDESKITADFNNGVLEVHVPKAALPQPKKINIGTGGNSRGTTQVHGSASNSSAAAGKADTEGTKNARPGTGSKNQHESGGAR